MLLSDIFYCVYHAYLFLIFFTPHTVPWCFFSFCVVSFMSLLVIVLSVQAAPNKVLLVGLIRLFILFCNMVSPFLSSVSYSSSGHTCV